MIFKKSHVKTLRGRNALFLAQLKIDQKFYASELKRYNEPEVRSNLRNAKTAVEDEKKRIDDMMKAMKKTRRPTEAELSKYNKLNDKLKKVEAVANEYDSLRQGQVKGEKAIENIISLLRVIDNLSEKEKDELNNL